MMNPSLSQPASFARSARSSSAKRHAVKAEEKTFTLLETVCIVVGAGLITGGAILWKECSETSRVMSQVDQIQEFDAAIAGFHEKYDGLPGDLLSVQAKRFDLPTGDGTPSHSDGDGKIAPCNQGLQWNLGCETALFWSQLHLAGFISDNFSADASFRNSRLFRVGEMFPYLPQSPVAEGVFITVWNTDPAQVSPAPQIPYGNYYEISRIYGVADERMKDSSLALTPLQAHSVDAKMDDGSPMTGRVIVNGEANWPLDAWGSYAVPDDDACVASDHTYNAYSKTTAHTPLCHLAIAFNCCAAREEEE